MEVLGQGWALEAVSLVGVTQVVLLEVGVEVTRDLGGTQVPLGAPLHPEALVAERAVHALDEAVAARRANACGSLLDALHGQEQLVGVSVGTATELAAVVREHGRHLDAERGVKGLLTSPKRFRASAGGALLDPPKLWA